MAKHVAEPPDEVLVVAAILGDLDAFDELATRYRAAVVRAAQSVVGREDAEDVAQDAWLLAFKALPSIEDPTRFAAWLAVITRHRAFRFNKQQRVHKAGHVELDEFLLEKLAALNEPVIKSEDDELGKALENLPADYAMALRLRFLDEMPLKRIAAFLSVPVSTVKWRVYRGKQLLREQVELLRQRGEPWKEIEK